MDGAPLVPTPRPRKVPHVAIATAHSAARDGVWLAVGSMFCVQLGIAASIGLMDQVGPAGAAWLRLLWAGILFGILGRPRLSAFSRDALAATIALGIATAGVTLLFMAAVARLPMGVASALEFLGPLGVALVRTEGLARAWAATAAVGVLLLTHPWSGTADLTGVGFAVGSALC